jgi:transcriptional regulator with XRE-family HTH domain
MDATENTNYAYFMAAFNHFMGQQQRWSGAQKRLHTDTGLSEAMISLIRSKRKRAGLKSQFKIAEALGFPLSVFLDLGRAICETGVAPDVRPSFFSRRAVDPANLYRLPPTEKKQGIFVDDRLAKIQLGAAKILKSGDARLISILESTIFFLLNLSLQAKSPVEMAAEATADSYLGYCK